MQLRKGRISTFANGMGGQGFRQKTRRIDLLPSLVGLWSPLKNTGIEGPYETNYGEYLNTLKTNPASIS